MGFNVYELDVDSKRQLLEVIPPKYRTVVADHITQNFGVSAGAPIPEPKSVKVVGVADDGRGLQGLIVEVDGERTRPDGKPFHITWSYDASKIAPAEFDPAPLGKQKAKTYRPMHTNALVACGDYSTFLEQPIEIKVTGKYLETQQTTQQVQRG